MKVIYALAAIALVSGCDQKKQAAPVQQTEPPRYTIVSGNGIGVWRLDTKLGTMQYCYIEGAAPQLILCTPPNSAEQAQEIK